jgi:hypothetical protein
MTTTMRPNKTLSAALALVALFFACEAAARACSCLPPGPPREQAAKAQAVFAGEVVEVIAPASESVKSEAVKKSGEDCARETPVWQSADAGDGQLRVRFKVTRVWKNVAGGEVFVTTPASSAACGYGFRKGETYVVYAYGGEEGRALSTGLCSRTRPLSSADEDLRDLGAGQPASQSAVASPLTDAATSAKPLTPKPRRLRRVPRRRRT